MNFPNLLLITIDCLRADHVGWHGYTRATTPFLDTLAAQSIIFENAIVAGLPTYYSFPAILAGRFPLRYGRDFSGLVSDEPTLASVLRDAGYHTAAFIAGNPYVGRWGGYARGFETFEDFIGAPSESDGETLPKKIGRGERLQNYASFVPGGRALMTEINFRYGVWIRARGFEKKGWEHWRAFPSAETLTQRALQWVNHSARAPFFLWLHYMDAHRPYFPSRVSPRRAFGHYNFWIRNDLSHTRRAKVLETERELYDASIRDVDVQIQRVVETLHTRGQFENTVLAITADHGEAFLEHGASDHDPISLHRELTHVPLLLRAREMQPKRIPNAMGLLDLPPTFLQMLQVPIPASFQGTSRADALRAGETWDDIVITEVVSGKTHAQILQGRALRPGLRLLNAQTERFKLLMDFAKGRMDLFDLATDSQEQNPLPLPAQRTIAARLLRAARNHLQKQSAQPCTRAQFDLRMELLRAQFSSRVAQTP